MTIKKYSVKLTGVSFLLYEIKQIVKLMQEDLNEKEIKTKVKEDNIFQYKKTSSLSRIIPTIYRRAALLPDDLKELILTENMKNAKLINLYAIMEEDLLFKDFMLEIIKEKYSNNNLLLERKDINSFFIEKAEQNKRFSEYKETTINKLRQVYFKILMESDILKDSKTGELNRILIDPYLKDVFTKNGIIEFVEIFK